MPKVISIKKFIFSTVGTGLILSVFILIAMFAIIVSQGKVIDTQTGKIKETGIIRINTTQSLQNVLAYVNNEQKFIKDNRIDFVDVGKISLRLSKTGFNSWTKDIELSSNKVKDIYPLFLPENLDSRINNLLKESSIEPKSVYFLDNLDYFFILVTTKNQGSNDGSKNNKNFEIWQYFRSDNSRLLNIFIDNNLRLRKVFEFSYDLSDLISKNQYELNFSPQGKSFILFFPSSKDFYVGKLNFDGQTILKNSELFSLNNKLSSKVDEIRWLREDRLLVRQNFNLFDYKISTDELNVILISSDPNYKYVINDSFTYVIRDKENALIQYDPFSLRRKKVQMPKNFIFPSEITGIYSKYSVKDVFLISSNQGLIYVNLNKDNTFYEILTQEDIFKVIDISKDGRKIILKEINNSKNQNKYYIYFLENIADNSSIQLVVNSIELLKSEELYFLDNSMHLIVYNKDSKTLSITDLDGLNKQKLNLDLEILDYFVPSDLRNIYVSSYGKVTVPDNANHNLLNLYLINLD